MHLVYCWPLYVKGMKHGVFCDRKSAHKRMQRSEVTNRWGISVVSVGLPICNANVALQIAQASAPVAATMPAHRLNAKKTAAFMLRNCCCTEFASFSSPRSTAADTAAIELSPYRPA